MLDFPASPTVGQQFTAAGVTWFWDGVKWLPSGLSPTVVPGINDNRIINGDMLRDQRNNGASGTASAYTVDRWSYNATQVSKGTWQRNPNSAAFPQFPYSLSFQSSSAYTPLASDTFYFAQPIEADMVSDFAWGTSQAQSVTLSFWAYSTLTGTFSGAISNYAGTRTYPFTFSLPTASTFTKIAITIPGDSAGTWVMSGNAGSLLLTFDLGSGANYRAAAGVWGAGLRIGANGAVNVVATNGATFNVTGVKLEIGSIATPYNRQSLAKSLADCQRYYQTGEILFAAYGLTSGSVTQSRSLEVAMRATPTMTFNPVTATNCTTFQFIADSNQDVHLNAVVVAAGMFVAIATFTASAEL
jgi:hypothetical protein